MHQFMGINNGSELCKARKKKRSHFGNGQVRDGLKSWTIPQMASDSLSPTPREKPHADPSMLCESHQPTPTGGPFTAVSLPVPIIWGRVGGCAAPSRMDTVPTSMPPVPSCGSVRNNRYKKKKQCDSTMRPEMHLLKMS